MLRFGVGFGLLECPLSEFNNEDIYGEDANQDKEETLENIKFSNKKKLKYLKVAFEETLDMER